MSENKFIGLPLADLERLREQIDEAIEIHEDDAAHAFLFTEIRTRLIKRFDQQRVDPIRHWRALSKTQRGQFKKAYMQAILDLKRLGLDNQLFMNQILIELVSESGEFERAVSFKSVTKSMESVLDLFRDAFPCYSQEAIRLLNRQAERK